MPWSLVYFAFGYYFFFFLGVLSYSRFPVPPPFHLTMSHSVQINEYSMLEYM